MAPRMTRGDPTQTSAGPEPHDDAGDPPRGRRLPAGLLLAVPLVLAVLAYARVLDGEFVFDDTAAIVENPATKDLGRLLDGIVFLGPGRPVTDLTFALNYAFGGLEPWNFHVTNLAIHLGVVLLVFAFTRSVAGRAGAERPDAIAVAVAGLFALHPLQTQAVSYVCQRSESLASGICLAVLLLLFEAERRGATWRGAAAWVGALLAFALGLGTKQIVLTAPLAYLLVGVALPGLPGAPQRARPDGRRVLLAGPLLALAVVHGIASLRSLGGRSDVGFDLPGLGPLEYLLTQSRVIVLYLRLLFWPPGQNAEWDVAPSRTLAEPAVLGSILLLLGLAAGAVWLVARARGRQGPRAAAARLSGLGVLWFFLLLSVTSSVLPLADVMFEHRVYLASWGVFVGPAAWLAALPARGGARARAAAMGALVALLGALAAATHARNAVWETRAAFARDALEKSPGKARVYVTMGYSLRQQGRHAEAIRSYEAGLERARAANDTRMEMQLLRNLGAAYDYSGRAAEGAAAFRAALAKGEHPDLLTNLAIAVLKLGDDGEAIRLARRALALKPDDVHATHSLGAILYQQGDLTGALPLLQRAAALDPDRPHFQVNLGRTLADAGRRGEACAAWRRALSARPDPGLSAVVAELVRGCP